MYKLAKIDLHFITFIYIMKLTWSGTPLIPIFIFTPIMGWFIPDIFMLLIAGLPILPLLETEAGVFPNTSNKSLLAVAELEELAAAGLNWEKSAKLSLLESKEKKKHFKSNNLKLEIWNTTSTRKKTFLNCCPSSTDTCTCNKGTSDETIYCNS